MTSGRHEGRHRGGGGGGGGGDQRRLDTVELY